MYEVMLKDERIDGNTPNWDGMSGLAVTVNDPIKRILSWGPVLRTVDQSLPLE